jgi:hypothetical protein
MNELAEEQVCELRETAGRLRERAQAIQVNDWRSAMSLTYWTAAAAAAERQADEISQRNPRLIVL